MRWWWPVAGAAVLAGCTGGSDGAASTTTTAPPGPAVLVPAPGQVFVSGTVTHAKGDGVTTAGINLPFTLEVAQRGGTGATFQGGSVAAVPSSIVWDGGRPLPMSGTGALDVNGSVDVDVSAAGSAWSLDGITRALEPGSYRLGATVAVGTKGLAKPKDGVVLDVPGGSGASVTTIGVRLTTPPRAVHLTGPGTLLLEGSITVRSRTSTRTVGSIRLESSPLDVVLEPAVTGGGYTIVTGVLQGTVTTGA